VRDDFAHTCSFGRGRAQAAMFFVFLKMLPFFMRKSEHANSEGATMRSVYCSLRAGHANSDWATMRNVAFYYLIIATNKLM
jgi:hypothetical protein